MQLNFACTGKEKFSDIGIQALDTNMKMPRKLFTLTGLFCAVSGKIDVDMADFTVIGKKRKRLGQNFELVRWARFRSDICQKYVLFVACNRSVGCS